MRHVYYGILVGLFFSFCLAAQEDLSSYTAYIGTQPYQENNHFL